MKRLTLVLFIVVITPWPSWAMEEVLCPELFRDRSASEEERFNALPDEMRHWWNALPDEVRWTACKDWPERELVSLRSRELILKVLLRLEEHVQILELLEEESQTAE